MEGRKPTAKGTPGPARKKRSVYKNFDKKCHMIVVNHLVSNFFKEAGLPRSARQFHSFRELLHYLNPMVKVSSSELKSRMTNEMHKKMKMEMKLKMMTIKMKVMKKKMMRMQIEYKKKIDELEKKDKAANKNLVIETIKEDDPIPRLPAVDPNCILCNEPVPTVKGRLLNVNEATKILMAAVTYGHFTIEKAKIAICYRPLRMCATHTNFAYDMMCHAIGAFTEKDVDRVSPSKLLERCELYKSIKAARDEVDGNTSTNPRLGSFKMAIKTFFRYYIPKHVMKEQEMQKRTQINDVLREFPPSTSLKDFLYEQNIEMSISEQLELLKALKPTRASGYTGENQDRSIQLEPADKRRQSQPGDNLSQSEIRGTWTPPDSEDQTTADQRQLETLRDFMPTRKNLAEARREVYSTEMRDETRELLKPHIERYQRNSAQNRAELHPDRQTRVEDDYEQEQESWSGPSITSANQSVQRSNVSYEGQTSHMNGQNQSAQRHHQAQMAQVNGKSQPDQRNRQAQMVLLEERINAPMTKRRYVQIIRKRPVVPVQTSSEPQPHPKSPAAANDLHHSIVQEETGVPLQSTNLNKRKRETSTNSVNSQKNEPETMSSSMPAPQPVIPPHCVYVPHQLKEPKQEPVEASHVESKPVMGLKEPKQEIHYDDFEEPARIYPDPRLLMGGGRI